MNEPDDSDDDDDDNAPATLNVPHRLFIAWQVGKSYINNTTTNQLFIVTPQIFRDTHIYAACILLKKGIKKEGKYELNHVIQL